MVGGKDEFLNDKDKVKNISAMSQNEDGMDMDFFKMADTIRRVQTVMNGAEKMQSQSNVTKESEEEVLPYMMNKQERILQAAIPFLDQDYQKNLYIVVRFLEMKRVLDQEGVLLETRSRKVDDTGVRQRKLLNAVRPFLSNEERNRVDWMVKMMDMRHILERKEEEK